jgi:hypothetical protein
MTGAMTLLGMVKCGHGTRVALVVLHKAHAELAKVTAILILTAKVVSNASRPKQAKRPQGSTSNPSKILG